VKATITALIATALALSPTTTATASPGSDVRFSVPGQARGTCVDAPLKITFPAPPTLGSSGAIEVRRADGTLVDRVEAAAAKADKKNIGAALSDGGLPHDFSYESIMIDGNTAGVYLHRQLEYGQEYYVTVEPGVFTGSTECGSLERGSSKPGSEGLRAGMCSSTPA
jgi:hypothetical protein